MDIKITLLFFFFIGSLCVTDSLGQVAIEEKKSERFFNHQFELRHDNDFFVLTDIYYTAGNFITYRFISENKKDTLNKIQHSISINQEVYNPSDLAQTDIDKLDRPYAGYLGLNYKYTLANTKRLFEFNYAIGVTGSASLASDFQNFFHTFTEDAREATWIGQIENSITHNFQLSYVREWKLEPNPFSVYFALNPCIALGTKDIYLQNDIVLYFGKRNVLYNSIAYNQIGKLLNEVFFSVRIGYKYALHNLMLEGKLIGNTSVFVVEPYRHYLLYDIGIYLRRGRHDLILTYKYTSAESRRIKPHLYVSLSIARSF